MAKSSVRKISFLACLFLVLLRMSIGWQFLYEGIWKLETQKTSRPWTAEGYLKNAQGPFRDTFRRMVDDPDSLGLLDYDRVTRDWDAWYARFMQHHPDLSDEQKRAVENLMNGPGEFSEKLAKLPPEVDLTRLKTPKGTWVKYDAKGQRLVTNLHLLPSERDALLGLAPAPEAAPEADRPVIEAYRAAVKRLFERTSKLSLKERLQVLVQEDPDRVGTVIEAHQGTSDYSRPGDLQIYTHWLERYRANLERAVVAFQHDHLSKQWQELQEKRGALVAPIEALTTELHAYANKLLSLEQLARGPTPAAPGKTRQINEMTIWTLIVLGGLLMVGLFSRLAAVGAAGLLMMFYLAMPPWPGVPQPPGPEHSLIVNKNLIEVIACLALACLPTGRWVGLDALVRRFIFRQRTD